MLRRTDAAATAQVAGKAGVSLGKAAPAISRSGSGLGRRKACFCALAGREKSTFTAFEPDL
jgi:hypothetical protein